MAVLTGPQLDAVRQPFVEEEAEGEALRRQVLNAAIQAIEDTFSGAAPHAAISNAIDAAISPATMAAARKRRLVKWWLKSRFERGN